MPGAAGPMGQPMSTLSHIKKGPKWSFNGRQEDLKEEKMQELPGPGQYGAPKHMSAKQAPQFSFGTDRRIKESNIQAPGPGAYKPSKPPKKYSPAYTLTPRRTYKETKDVPGPGAHDLPNVTGRTGPKYGFTQEERNQWNTTQVPGPATYNVTEPTTRGQTWKFGTAHRDPIDHKDTPGPGSYSISGTLAGPKFSAAPRREETRIQETPGPVSYQIESTIGKKQAFSMSARYENPKGTLGDAPGPGHYSARTAGEKIAPKYGFGTEARTARDRIVGPGPGAYTPAEKKEAFKYKFPKADRGATRDTGSPGPGHYDPKKEPKRRGPGYSLSARLTTAEERKAYKGNQPGPGEYDQDKKTGPSPRWGFGTSARMASNQTSAAAAPGPGTYQSSKTFSGPKFGFARARRRPLGESDTPGPGAHEVAVTQFGY